MAKGKLGSGTAGLHPAFFAESAIFSLSAPNCLLLLLPAERQASREWLKLLSYRANFGFIFWQKSDFFRRTLEIGQKVSRI